MIDQMFPNLRAFQQYWSRTVASMVWGQWLVLDTGLQAAQTVLTSATTVPPDSSAHPRRAAGAAKSGPQGLVDLAVERMGKGLAPPSEVYQTPYRNQIDWSKCPEWARPSDPELFEGSGHEG